MQSILILGRQPKLGLAELESLYGKEKLRPVGAHAVVVDIDPCLLRFERLGGCIKFAKVLTEVKINSLKEIGKFLNNQGPENIKRMPPGKMHLGISTYGYDVTAKQVQRLAIELKQSIRTTGRNVRVIPNNNPYLSSAQVIHGKLTSITGWELLLIKSPDGCLIAQTIKAQDIEAYTRRDRVRPNRDMRVGMLPPKLAQIIINLAVGKLPDSTNQSVCEIPEDQIIPKQHFKTLILDPFCGSGVILQEAAIMGYDILGSDMDQRMVESSLANIKWLRNQPFFSINPEISIEVCQADATKFTWAKKPQIIASETYLGRNFTSQPSFEEIANQQKQINQLLINFLQNIAPKIDRGTRFCLAVPAWKNQQGKIVHLPFIDSLEAFGYNRISFHHCANESLVYLRPSQVVARELLVIKKV